MVTTPRADRTLQAAPAQGPRPGNTGASCTTDGAGPLVLTTGHIWARGKLTVSRGGSLVELRGSLAGPLGDRPRRVQALTPDGELLYAPGPGGQAAKATRGAIKGYSRRSRGRQMRYVASIDWEALPCLPLFITLTYPGQFDGDPQRWKRDLQTFCRRVERKYGDVPILWRLELQKRGAPHFHLLVFNVRFMGKKWLADSWYDVVGSGDERHRRRGTRVESLRSWRGVMHYVSKYIAKVDDGEGEAQENVKIGRHWGIRNAPALPRELLEVEVDGETFQRIRRALRALAKARGRHWTVRGRYAGGWTFAGEDTKGKLLLLAGVEGRPATEAAWPGAG